PALPVIVKSPAGDGDQLAGLRFFARFVDGDIVNVHRRGAGGVDAGHLQAYTLRHSGVFRYRERDRVPVVDRQAVRSIPLVTPALPVFAVLDEGLNAVDAGDLV